MWVACFRPNVGIFFGETERTTISLCKKKASHCSKADERIRVNVILYLSFSLQILRGPLELLQINRAQILISSRRQRLIIYIGKLNFKCKTYELFFKLVIVEEILILWYALKILIPMDTYVKRTVRIYTINNSPKKNFARYG